MSTANVTTPPDLPRDCLEGKGGDWPVWWIFITGVGVGMCALTLCLVTYWVWRGRKWQQDVWGVMGPQSPHSCLAGHQHPYDPAGGCGSPRCSCAGSPTRSPSYSPPRLDVQIDDGRLAEREPSQRGGHPLRLGQPVTSPVDPRQGVFPHLRPEQGGGGGSGYSPLFVTGSFSGDTNSPSRSPTQQQQARSPHRRGVDLEASSIKTASAHFGAMHAMPRSADPGGRRFMREPSEIIEGPPSHGSFLKHDLPASSMYSMSTHMDPSRSPNLERSFTGSMRAGNRSMACASPRQRRRALTGQWTKGKLLGQGASGKVYMGVKEDGSILAVKVLDLQAIGTDENQTTSLIREIELLSKLSHERIVDYYGCQINEQLKELHIMMEYVSNGSLGYFVRSLDSPLAEAAVAKYTVQILEGVRYLHDNQIVHRDLKGDNILLTHDGECKISDFGTSKSMVANGLNGNFAGIGDYTGATSYKVAGTPLWSAPEVFQETYSLESDIWSLGCVVCEMLTGKPPWPQFETVWAAISTIGKCKSFPPEMPKSPDVTEDCENFLRECLAYKPAERSTAAKLQEHVWLLNVIREDDEEEEEEEEEEEVSGGLKVVNGHEIYTPILPGNNLSVENHNQGMGHLLRRISEINTPMHARSQAFPVSPRRNFDRASRENMDNSISTPTTINRRTNVVINESQVASTQSSSSGDDHPPKPIYKRPKGRLSSQASMLQSSIGMERSPLARQASAAAGPNTSATNNNNSDSDDEPPVRKRRPKGRLTNANNMLMNSVGIDAKTLAANTPSPQGRDTPARQSSLRKSPTAQGTPRGSVTFPKQASLNSGSPPDRGGRRASGTLGSSPTARGSGIRGIRKASPTAANAAGAAQALPPPSNDSSDDDVPVRVKRRPKGRLTQGRNMLLDSVELERIPDVDSGESINKQAQ